MSYLQGNRVSKGNSDAALPAVSEGSWIWIHSPPSLAHTLGFSPASSWLPSSALNWLFGLAVRLRWWDYCEAVVMPESWRCVVPHPLLSTLSLCISRLVTLQCRFLPFTVWKLCEVRLFLHEDHELISFSCVWVWWGWTQDFGGGVCYCFTRFQRPWAGLPFPPGRL